MHESTKRLIDAVAAVFLAASAGVSAMTLADWALIVTIIAGALNAVWTAMRIFGGAKYGRRGD